MKKFLLITLLFVSSLYSQCVPVTTWDGFIWDNGMPNSTISAIINGPYDTSNDGDIYCCSLTVNSGNTLIVNNYCSVSGNIQVLSGATLNVKSGGSLIPVNVNCVMTGNVIVERRTPSTKRYDYTYWSSPVTTTIGNALLPAKWEPNYTFTFNTPNYTDIETSYWGTFISSTPDGQDDNGDDWVNTSLSDYMIPGKGYASMISSIIATGTYPRTELVTFTGHLNTGIITLPLLESGNSASDIDDFNLVGNPYSSSINSNDLIDANLSNISGTLYFWTHTSTMLSSYTGLALYNYSTNDYAKYTKLGGVSAVLGGKKPINIIGSCQAFMVEAENQPGDLTFLPLFMSTGYRNDTGGTFYKSSSKKVKRNLWLNMENEEGLFSQQLIGYNNETNQSYNKGWDSKVINTRQLLKFYSVEDDVMYDIQARGSFDKDDLVHLGYTTVVEDTFTISVDSKEGKMKDQDVYLYDNAFDIWHDLSEPYTFSTVAGTFNTRFFIKYESPDEEGYHHNGDHDEHKEIFTNNRVEVYDMIGRLIDTLDCICLDSLPNDQIFIIKIYEGEKITTKKFINRL